MTNKPFIRAVKNMNFVDLLYPKNSLAEIVFKEALQALNKNANASIKELEELALKADIEAKILQNQAKVEQELAIANRIATSEEVEIEEFYDTSGKGTAGLSAEESKLTLGLSAEGRKVTKRVIKFKGHTITQIIENDEQ